MTSPGKTESLDPITVEVVRYKLDGIANEMELTLLRSSFSPIVKLGVPASGTMHDVSATPIEAANITATCWLPDCQLT